MKTKEMKTLLTTVGLILLSLQIYNPVHGQSDDWKNNENCLKNLSMYYEFYKHKNYEDAITPWKIVYSECPESKESLYAYGVTMYKYFIAKETNAEKKAALIDTMLMIYDKRIEYFPKNKGDVLGRKGVDILRYQRQDGEEFIKKGYNILSESVEIEKMKSSAVVLTTQISAGISLFLNESLDDETLINNYVTASEILDAQIAKRPSSKTKKAKEAINQNIKESRVMTCESIVSIFGPKFEENKDNLKFLNLVAGFLNDAGTCDKEALYAQVAERRYELEPSASAAFSLGVLFQNKSEYKKAKEYFLLAIETTEINEDKATYYYRLAFLSHSYLDKPDDAAKYATKAVEIKPDWGDPYILMGMAFVGGNSSLGDEFERRTAYWVAVDMFIKAKSVDPSVSEKAGKLIHDYTSYFPTKEDLFFRSISKGDRYTVGGWINKTTFARSKN